jgi:hypothetical protein
MNKFALETVNSLKVNKQTQQDAEMQYFVKEVKKLGRDFCHLDCHRLLEQFGHGF